ncbi:MAG: RnfABCDGE type electron transport complex subunit A [Bacteroidaceae bacterium]|nr:RnfABCDGE type electron transport complex subunit A [Bacteroidaceae bacterium]
MAYILIFITAIFVNNIVLSQFLGICPFLGVSKKVDTALGMSAAVAFVLTIATIVTYLLQEYVLVPFDLVYLQTIAFILVIAALVQMVEIVLKKVSPSLYQALGVFLPLITTNCCILGVAILVANGTYSSAGLTPGLVTGVWYALCTALGFGLALTVFAGLREHLSMMPVPKTLQGMSIALITAGLLAMAFMGFSGVDNGLIKVFNL